jgi:alpha-beta hydrolase superfamily lysophospholipase
MTTANTAPNEATTRMPDGTTLRTLHWEPQGDPWAVALVVHGLGEHAGRYGNVARVFTASGIDVHGYDHRGFGGSAGRRAYVDHWAQYHDDLARMMTAIRLDHQGLPVVLYGHSLGGLITLGYVLAATPQPEPDLLVLSAPGIDADIPGWKRAVAATLSSVFPRMRIANGLPAGGLSRDPSVRANADTDPLCVDSSTVRFGKEAFDEQARVRGLVDKLPSLPIPTYVFHGSDDPIVPVGVTERFEGKGNVTRRVHPGLRHECHNEPEHADVLAEVVAWIRANAAAATPAATLPAAEERVPAGTAR